jgi:hypothetical protein
MTAFDKDKAEPTDESSTADVMEDLRATSLGALRKHEATVSALGAELLGNGVVYVGSLYYATLAVLEQSSEPLSRGSHDFTASAATLMVILPLLYEKAQERHEFLKLKRLERILESHDTRHPDMPLTPAVRRFVTNELGLLPKEPHGEMSKRDEDTASHILNQAHDRLHPNDHTSQSKFDIADVLQTGKYVFEDLGKLMSPQHGFRNIRALAYTFGVGAAHLALKPIKELYDIEIEKNHPELHREIMDGRIRNLIERDKRAVALEHDEERDRFAASPEHIDAEIKRQSRKMDNRSLRLTFSVSMMAGAGAFLAVEGAQLSELVHSFAEAQTPGELATKSAVILGYAFATACSILPFQKGANSFAENASRIETRKNIIETLKYLKVRIKEAHEAPLQPDQT